MPWQEKSIMKLRQEFVVAVADPDRSVAEVCREYGISRRTGYKWIKRYRDRGELGLCDRTRRPNNRPLETNAEMVLRVIELRREKPRRGPKKIHELLLRAHGDKAPSQRTVAPHARRAQRGDERAGRADAAKACRLLASPVRRPSSRSGARHPSTTPWRRSLSPRILRRADAC